MQVLKHAKMQAVKKNIGKHSFQSINLSILKDIRIWILNEATTANKRKYIEKDFNGFYYPGPFF